MKKLLLSTLAVCTFLFGQAQLPANSICPDFTGTDLNGNVWNLYEILDSGKPVIIEVSAAWCGPCWSYHSTGSLKNFYNQYGPNGTNEAMVLFIEGESTNSLAQLQGITTSQSYAGFTKGDWITGTPFPIIDDASIANLLQISAFPTIYAVCPDRIINEIGQVTTVQAYNHVSNSNCTSASFDIDARLFGATGINANCLQETAGVSVILQNKGLTPLTEATFTITGIPEPIVHEWTGNLATYEIEEVEIIGIVAPQPTNITVSITSADDNPANNSKSLSVTSAIQASTTHIRVVFKNDPWPGENSWKIRNSTGSTVATSPSFPATMSSAVTNTYDYYLPGLGCYSFEFTDAYGDGLNGAPYGYWNGNIKAYSVAENGATTLLYINNGTEPMASQGPATEKTTFSADTQLGTNDFGTNEISLFSAFPNPASNMIHLNYSLNAASEVSVDIINAVGANVISKDYGIQSQGEHIQQLDLSMLSEGIYMINLNTEGKTQTLRVVVNK